MFTFLVSILLVDQTKITFDSPAKPAPDVIRALGDQAGVTLRAAPVFARQVVAVSTKGVPLPEVLDRLASTLGGEWREDGKVRRLERFVRIARAIERRERITRVSALRASIAESAKASQIEAPFTEKEALDVVADALSTSGRQGERASLRAPAGRLLHRLLDDEVLFAMTALAPSERLVWTSRPHPSQKPFSSRQEDALAKFTAELKTWQTAVTSSAAYSGGVLGDRSEMAVTGVPSRTLLIVQRHAGGQGFNAKVYVTDRSGRIIGRQILNVNESIPPIPLTPVKDEKVDLRLSERGQRMARLISNPREGWTGDLADVTRRDPLEGVSELVVEAASRRRTNVIAVLPDNVFRAYPSLQKGPQSATSALNLTSRFGARYEESNDWAIITPSLPWTEERVRTDRPSLEKMLLQLARGGSILETLGAYMASASEGAWSWGGIDYSLADACIANLKDQASTHQLPPDGLALACFGALSSEQKTALLRNGTTPVVRLPQAFRTNIERMAYRIPGMRLVRRPPESDAAALRDLELSLATENTEVLPEGLPNESTLTLTHSGTAWSFLLSLGNGAELAFRLEE